MDRLEKQLETWVEGTLARWLGGDIPAAVVAGQLARAMEDGLRWDEHGKPRAPDQYALALHPQDMQALLERGAEWTSEMAAALLSAAMGNGYSMAREPHITFAGDPGLTSWQIRVIAWHSETPLEFTQTVDRPAQAIAGQAPVGAFLIVDGDRHVTLDRPILNIGRRAQNQLILDRPYVSRTHAQLRAREGRFVLFDLGSAIGTSVNGRPVRQHILRPGDVINIGPTRLVYGEDPGTGSDVTTALTPPVPRRPASRDEGSAAGPSTEPS
ncbi:MAG: FhaA domain-containing protein [Anaerolineales bacterium]